jgi:hypothetical protein
MSDHDIENLRQDYRQLIGLVMQAVEGTKDNAIGIQSLDGKIMNIASRLSGHMDDEEEKIELTGLRIEALTTEVKSMRELCVDGRHCRHHAWVERKMKWARRRDIWFTATGSQALRALAIAAVGLLAIWLSDGFFAWLAAALGGVK